MRGMTGVIAIAIAALVAAALAAGGSQLRAVPAASLAGLHVSGNQLVDAGGSRVRLLGVNRSGTEYACIQGWGIFDGPNDAASVQAIAGWHANAVRVPLNEDCWLNINGVAAAYGGANYQNAIVSYVNLLNANGLYAILDLHWTAPGTHQATAQAAMPDADHTPAFWSSVANTFKSNPNALFDLFNEPFPGQDGAADPWGCWLNGCALTDSSFGTWQAAGMQSLVSAVRQTGATNVLMAGGLSWSNDLSGWLAHKPADPAGNLAASWHSYPNNACNTQSCWDAQVATVAAQSPVITGEVGDSVCNAATYLPALLPYLDGKGISYLGWTWDTWSQCANVLITSYTGTPTANFGQYFHDHLAAIGPAPSPSPSASASPSPPPSPSPSPTPRCQKKRCH
jgi:endoglucanase